MLQRGTCVCVESTLEKTWETALGHEMSKCIMICKENIQLACLRSRQSLKFSLCFLFKDLYSSDRDKTADRQAIEHPDGRGT